MELISKNLTRPNGIAFSPDYSKLYVANSDDAASTWTVFDVDANGAVSNERLFYDATADPEPGAPDGMKVDREGNIYATGPGGVWIFSPEAKVIGRIRVGQLCSNIAFDTDERYMFITADPWLVRVTMKR